MSTVRLTPTSYVVLGLLERLQPATPYDLKRAAQLGVSNLWSLPHAQLYVEPARLAAAGLLSERQEAGSRRRKRYARVKDSCFLKIGWQSDLRIDAS